MSDFTVNPVRFTSQNIDNEGYNFAYKIPTVGSYGYDAHQDAFVAKGVNTGLIPVQFSRITFSNADGNGNYQTGTVKNGTTTVGTLSLAYDGSSNLTDIQFTVV